MKKFLFTGGHLTPALALIDFLRNKHQNEIKFIFAGRRYNLANDKNYSLEFQEIEKREIKFIDFKTGKLKREISINALINLVNILKGIIAAWFLIRKEKPDLIFSFGGFIGFPFCFAGWLNRTPVFIHEQTISPGFANKLSGLFAKKIFVSFYQSAGSFNKKKVIISGNPIRDEILKTIKKPFEIIKNKPVIYITGGSLGSHSINQHIERILPELLKRTIVIHQTGSVKEYNDFERLLNFKKKLPRELTQNYYLRTHFLTSEIGYIYSISDLVISRAGANTFFELLTIKKPAILIPLPWSIGNEQKKHAEIFVNLGLGEIFNQFAESNKLLLLINQMIDNLNIYQKNFNKPELDLLLKKNACEIIYEEIFLSKKN